MTDGSPSRGGRTVWIINPYGSLPTERWTTYRSTMLAECLVGHGYEVTQFISNFEHRSKTFRATGAETRHVRPGYTIQIVPSSPYEKHISVARIRYERTFAHNLVGLAASATAPDFIVLAEPSLFYYDILLRPLILRPPSVLVLDIIDIWPELLELAVPRPVRFLSRALLAPLYYWRRKLYRYPQAIVAVARDYENLARQLTDRPEVLFETVYWSYDSQAATASSVADGRVQELVSRKQPNEVWIVYAGTLGENYDINAIITASKTLAEAGASRVPFKIIMAGDGPLKGLCEASTTDTLRFLGRLGAADMQQLYRACDVALATYKGESTVAMPIKAFDCLLYGLPIVNSLGRDLGALVRDHQIGLNYEAGSPASLAQALNRLIVDAELRSTCSGNARALAPQFSSDVQYAKFAALLRRLSDGERYSGRSTQ